MVTLIKLTNELSFILAASVLHINPSTAFKASLEGVCFMGLNEANMTFVGALNLLPALLLYFHHWCHLVQHIGPTYRQCALCQCRAMQSSCSGHFNVVLFHFICFIPFFQCNLEAPQSAMQFFFLMKLLFWKFKSMHA